MRAKMHMDKGEIPCQSFLVFHPSNFFGPPLMSDNTTGFEQKSLFTTLHSTGWGKNPRLALNGDF